MFKGSVLLGVGILLTGCGGGSDSSSTPSSGSTGGGTTPVAKNVSAVLEYVNACGMSIPATDAAVIVHNNDMSNKDVFFADQSGNVTIENSQDTLTLSVVFRGQSEVAGVKPVHMKTYIDHPAIELGTLKHFTKDASTCECQTTNVIVNLPDSSLFPSSSSLRNYKSIGGKSSDFGRIAFSDVEYCKDQDGQWPVLTAFVKVTDDETYGAVLDNISAVSEVDANLTGQALSVNTRAPFKQYSARIGNAQHFSNSVYSSQESIHSFNSTLIEQHYVSAYSIQNLDNIPEAEDAFELSIVEKRTQDVNQTFDLTLPTLDYPALGEILEESGSYSIAHNRDFDFVFLAVEAIHDDKPLLDWQVVAPLSGRSISIDNIDIEQFIPEASLDQSVDSVLITLAAEGYDYISSYDEFLRTDIAQRNSQAEPEESMYYFSQRSFVMSELGFSAKAAKVISTDMPQAKSTISAKALPIR